MMGANFGASGTPVFAMHIRQAMEIDDKTIGTVHPSYTAFLKQCDATAQE